MARNRNSHETRNKILEVSKDLFLEILEEDILPWWECDVEKHVVGSKVKSFQVYIVEN